MFVTFHRIVALLSACRSLALQSVCTLAGLLLMIPFAGSADKIAVPSSELLTAVSCSTSSLDGRGKGSPTRRIGKDLYHRCRQMWGDELYPSSNRDIYLAPESNPPGTLPPESPSAQCKIGCNCNLQRQNTNTLHTHELWNSAPPGRWQSLNTLPSPDGGHYVKHDMTKTDQYSHDWSRALVAGSHYNWF